jgi:hypothetical protein
MAESARTPPLLWGCVSVIETSSSCGNAYGAGVHGLLQFNRLMIV